MYRLSIILLIIILNACSGGDSHTDPSPSQIAPQGQSSDLKKISDLSRAEYRSYGCQAVVSGVDEPKQLILSYSCSGLRRAHTLSCTSDHFCIGTFAEKRRIEVGLSQDFRQMAIVWYYENGDIGDSQSFLMNEPENQSEPSIPNN